MYLVYNPKWEREIGMYTLHIYTNIIAKIVCEATDVHFEGIWGNLIVYITILRESPTV